MNPEVMRRRDELSEKYQSEIFKTSPDGFHIAPWVNCETLADAYSQGFDAGFTDKDSAGPIISELVEALNAIIPTVHMTELGYFKKCEAVAKAQIALEKYKTWEAGK